MLSGGGARGLAHIGVLKVLRDLRVPVDCIAGTSMGGIVGAVYATGAPVSEMESKVKAIDWKMVFQDRPDRRLMTERRKREETGYLARPEVGFRDGTVQFPQGVLYGQNIEREFADLAYRGEDASDFSQLPFPFKAVATDIATGTPYVLDKGSLAKAMRATMSVPGVMAPVEIDGHMLVDGGLVENLPVELVRKMCADVVIAVNLGTPLLKASEITSIFSVSEQMINILTEQNVRASLAQLRPGDVLISPELGDIGAGSFDRAADAIAIGEKAALAHEAELRRFSLPPAQYSAELRERRAVAQKSYRIDEVRVAPMQHVNPQAVENEIKVKPGTTVTRGQINDDVQRVYATGDFESVGEHTLRDGDRTIALFEPKEKSWGPNYLRFGLSLSANVGHDTGFTIVGRSDRRWMNSNGGEWINQLQVGEIAGFLSEFYQPFAPGSPWFAAPRVTLYRMQSNVFLGDDKVALYRRQSSQLGLDLGREIGTLGEARIGFVGGRLDSSMDIGPPVLPSEKVRLNAWTARMEFDQLDDYNFPNEGQRGRVDLFAPRKSLGSDQTYDRLQVDWTGAATWNNNTFTANALIGRSLGDAELPFFDAFTLGGFQKLSGYDRDRFRALDVAFGSLGYRRVVRPPLGLQLGGILDRMYAGASLEAGRIRQSVDPLTPDGTYYSGSLYVGADTLIGPMFLAFGQGEGNNRAVWLAIGRPWQPR
ncbi:MAG TPA: patatin-like phospholipase family protein [Burkholderiales bacterium]|nr:patatin-like phospholipase family protein [Burkholderiales bacterium]